VFLGAREQAGATMSTFYARGKVTATIYTHWARACKASMWVRSKPANSGTVWQEEQAEDSGELP